MLLRFVVGEQGQPALPGLDLDAARVVIGSGPDAHVRLPAVAARPAHVVIESGRWRAEAEVTVDGVARAVGDAGPLDPRADVPTVAGGGGDVARGSDALVIIDIGNYRVQVVRAPAEAMASSPQRTESLARELMRGLLGSGAAPTLAIERGPKAGARRMLQPPESTFVIGRGDDADWQILDEDLSRRHVEIRRGWEGTTLCDLGSQNGTRVDGEPVAEVALYDGARIELGNLVIVYADPAERHLAGAVTPARPIEKPAVDPPSRPRASTLPFIVAATIAGLAIAALVYLLAS